MYRSGQSKKRPRGLTRGVRERAKKVTDSPSHVVNKPHILIIAGHKVMHETMPKLQQADKDDTISS